MYIYYTLKFYIIFKCKTHTLNNILLRFRNIIIIMYAYTASYVCFKITCMLLDRLKYLYNLYL